MNNTTIRLAAILSAIAMLLIGCHGGGAYSPKNTVKYDLENVEPFVLLGERVQRSITCSGIQQRLHADGRLEVAANVRNREHRNLQVQINCEFKDEQGFVVDDTPFEFLMLSPLAQETVRWVSTSPQARRFTIRVREVK